jgi:hypothetical protein
MVGYGTTEEDMMIDLIENAYHEAGHAVAALALGRQLESVWVQPDAGCTRMELLPECPTTAQVREQLLIDVAGWVARAMYNNPSRVPARFQRFVSQEVHHLSRNLRALGVLRGVAPADELDQRSDEVQAWNAVSRLPGTAAEHLDEVERAETAATELLRLNWPCVERIASTLWQSQEGYLAETELQKIIELAGGVKRPAADP